MGTPIQESPDIVFHVQQQELYASDLDAKHLPNPEIVERHDLIPLHRTIPSIKLNIVRIFDGCCMQVPQSLSMDLGGLAEVSLEFTDEVRQAGVDDTFCSLTHI